MELPINFQTNKGLYKFQKLIVQDLYIKQLNKWMDELDWEIEKKDTIIKNKEEEIALLHESISEYQSKIKQLTKELADVTDRYRRATANGSRVLVRTGKFPK